MYDNPPAMSILTRSLEFVEIAGINSYEYENATVMASMHQLA